jgi:hypothetical protein
MMKEWIAVDDSMPVDSSACLVTDGKNISVAHWFSSLYSPSTGETRPGEWVNQHDRITGGFVELVTHWMPMQTFAVLMFGGGS